MLGTKQQRAVKAAGSVALAVAVLVACTSNTRPEGKQVADDAALDRFYQQQLAWGACGTDYASTDEETKAMDIVPGLECARLEVPLDYDDSENDIAEIAVSRVPSRGDGPSTPLVINPGGPGGSGVVGAILTALGLVESPITENFDIVGFDPRGVGASQPAVDCYSDEEADAGTVPLGSLGTTVEFTSDDTQAIMDKCAERSGGVDALAHVGTRDTARDMDVLRAALGQDKLTYFGQSYGSRLGAVYAEQFPDRVRALLFDAAVDPRLDGHEAVLSSYGGFQQAFDGLATECAARFECPLGNDPARATLRFQQLVRPLRTEPVPALDTTLSFDDAIGSVISGLYAPDTWPLIVDGLAELARGRGDGLMQLLYTFGGRSAAGQWTNFTEANYAINCMDLDRLTPTRSAELRRWTYDLAPFMDPGVDVADGARDACEHWPAEPTLGFPYAQDVDGLPPTLVVSTTRDPSTPHSGGVSLADSLGSSLLTVEGGAHGIVGQGTNACVDGIVSDYLINLQVPDEDARCIT